MTAAHEVQQRLQQQEEDLSAGKEVSEEDVLELADPLIEFSNANRPILRFENSDQLELMIVALDYVAGAHIMPLSIHQRFKAAVDEGIDDFASPAEISLLNQDGQIIVGDTLYTLLGETYTTVDLKTGRTEKHEVEYEEALIPDGPTEAAGKTYFDVPKCTKYPRAYTLNYDHYFDITVCTEIITYRKGWPIRRYYARGQSFILDGLRTTKSGGPIHEFNTTYGTHKLTVHFKNKTYDLLGRLIDNRCTEKTTTHRDSDGKMEEKNHIQCGGFIDGKAVSTFQWEYDEFKSTAQTPGW